MDLMFPVLIFFFLMLNSALYSAQYSEKDIDKIKEKMAPIFYYARVSLSPKMKISLLVDKLYKLINVKRNVHSSSSNRQSVGLASTEVKENLAFLFSTAVPKLLAFVLTVLHIQPPFQPT